MLSSVLFNVTAVTFTFVTFKVKLTDTALSAISAVMTVVPVLFTFNCAFVSVFSVSCLMVPASVCHVSPKKDATSGLDEV